MIKENNISYTPEKIDEFITNITKDISTAENIYRSSLSKVLGLTVGEIAENSANIESYKDKLAGIVEAISKQHTKYFNIIDAYGVGEEPTNVKKLSKLTDKLDDYYSDLSKIEDVLDDLIIASKKLTNFYNN
jgi:hypothetical protein